MSLVLLLSLFMDLSRGPTMPPPPTCSSNYTTINDAFNGMDNLTYPTAQFNPGCLSLDCPSLASLPCPYNIDNTKNSATVNQILASVSTCLQEHSSICNTLIQDIPVCTFGLTYQAFFNVPFLSGTLGVTPNTIFITGIPQAGLTYDSQNDLYVIYLNNLVYNGEINGSIGLAGTDLSLTIPESYFNVNLTLSLIIKITPLSEFPVQVVNTTVSCQVVFGNFFPNFANDPIFNNFENALNKISSDATLVSPVPDAVAKFIGTIIAKALLLADKNCLK